MRHPVHRFATIALAATMAASGLALRPTTARAATYEELQQQVEESTEAYDEAVAHVEAIQGDIEENEKQISQIEEKIPAQRARAADSLRILYKMQQSSGGLLDLVLASENWEDFIATLTYLDRIQSYNLSELEELGVLQAELQEAKDTLSAREAQANHELDRAREAREDAIAAREEARQQAIAQAEAERAAAEAALAMAAHDAEEGNTFTNASGQETEVETPESSETVTDDTSEQEESQPEKKPEEQKPAQEEQKPAQEVPASARDTFVAKWAPRINAYLSGSPLGGYGKTFAEAAYDYNVDPRWSPAIACIESGKGSYCYRSHNAWGWGGVNWPDWDTAIRSHVAGLSAGYGYTISVTAAQQYCPPTWQAWYSSVLSQMNCI